MNPHIRLKTVSIVYKERKLKESDSKLTKNTKQYGRKANCYYPVTFTLCNNIPATG